MLYQNHQRALGCEGIWRSRTLKPEFTRSSSWNRKNATSRRAGEIYHAMHRRRARQIQEFTVGETCPGKNVWVKNSEGFTTLSINVDLFHLEEETESQYGNLITTSSQDILREGRITQVRIGKLKASGPSDRS